MISTRQLSYNKQTCTFSVEITELRGVNIPTVAREGLTIKSHTTGKTEVFTYDRVDKDEDDDVHGWWFKSVNNFNGQKLKLLIIND